MLLGSVHLGERTDSLPSSGTDTLCNLGKLFATFPLIENLEISPISVALCDVLMKT